MHHSYLYTQCTKFRLNTDLIKKINELGHCQIRFVTRPERVKVMSKQITIQFIAYTKSPGSNIDSIIAYMSNSVSLQCSDKFNRDCPQVMTELGFVKQVIS